MGTQLGFFCRRIEILVCGYTGLFCARRVDWNRLWMNVVLQCVAVCCSVSQCVAVCCSVLQCVVVCCSVLQSTYNAH